MGHVPRGHDCGDTASAQVRSARIRAARTAAFFAFAQPLPSWVKSPSSLHPTQFVGYLWQFYLPRPQGMAPMIGPK